MKTKVILKALSVLIIGVMLSGCSVKSREIKNMAKENQKKYDESIEEDLGSIKEEKELVNNMPVFDISVGELTKTLKNLNYLNHEEDEDFHYFKSEKKYYEISYSNDEVGAIYITMFSLKPTEDEKLMKELNETLNTIVTALGENFESEKIISFFESGYPFEEFSAIEKLYSNNLKLFCQYYNKNLEFRLLTVY